MENSVTKHRGRIRRRIQRHAAYNNGTQVFRIKSRRLDDGTEYLVTVNPSGSVFCNCPSHRPCWHISRALLNLRRAETGASTQSAPVAVAPERGRYVGIIDED